MRTACEVLSKDGELDVYMVMKSLSSTAGLVCFLPFFAADKILAVRQSRKDAPQQDPSPALE